VEPVAGVLGAVAPPGDAEAEQVEVRGEDHRTYGTTTCCCCCCPGFPLPPGPGPLWGGRVGRVEVVLRSLRVFTVLAVMLPV